MHAITALIFAVEIVSLQASRLVTGEYRLPARGFAVDVPPDVTGFLDGDPALQRGVRIALPSGGTVFVYADMNVLEWRTPAEGVESVMSPAETKVFDRIAAEFRLIPWE